MSKPYKFSPNLMNYQQILSYNEIINRQVFQIIEMINYQELNNHLFI
jgi:hypothetical protein